MSGTASLEGAIGHMGNKMRSSNLDNVHSESAMIPKWEINEQWAVLKRPVEHRMSILTLGTSVGTNGTLEADVQLVHSFDELAKLGSSGKIDGPSFKLYNDNSKYFYFHHTSGDTMTVEDPDALDKSTILWAAASYVLADLSVDIGKRT